jgi:hypothetical protein
MIIYGSAGKEIASGKIRAACTNCQEPNTINMFIVQRYAHVYWIPLFPAEKKAVSECTSCNHVLEKKQFPERYKSEYEDLKSNSKTPIWMFTGLGIIAVIIAAVFITSALDDTENAELVLSPQKGDLYEIKLSDKEYTLYRVDKVEGNAVYVFENEYAVDQAEGVRDLLLKPFYKESAPIMKTDLKAMLEKGEIMDIER